MKINQDYKILKNAELIIEFYRDEVDIIRAKKQRLNMLNHSEFNGDFGFLVDLRGTKLPMELAEIDDYANFVIKNVIPSGLKNIAILTDTPEQVVRAMLFTLKLKKSSINYNIFSTIEPALAWLRVDVLKFVMIKEELENLKNQKIPI